VARVHNGIGWESPGGGGFGFSGWRDGRFSGCGWEYHALTEAREGNAEFLAELAAAGLRPRDVLGASEYGQNWLIWHPVRRNGLGEPALYFVSHEDCVARPVAAADNLSFGPLLLSVMGQEILGLDLLDEVYS
jgi:hypothetical protein